MKIIPTDIDHGSAHLLLSSIIMPRPIAFVSTVDENEIHNLAPFSSFTSICLEPAVVCFSIAWRRDGQKKDTLKNIEWCGDFVINVVDENLAETMNQTAADYPSNVDEFKEVGLTPVNSEIVKAPRVAESPINMECQLRQIITFGSKTGGSHLIIGEVILVHIIDEIWINGEIQLSKLKAIGRLGGNYYSKIGEKFEMKRPKS